MHNRQERKAAMLKVMLRNEQWNTEYMRSDASRAEQLFEQAERECKKADQAAQTLEQGLRYAYAAGAEVPLEEVNRMREYSYIVQGEQQRKHAGVEKARELVDKTSAQLKKSLVRERGLKKLGDEVSVDLAKSKQRKMLNQLDELCVSRKTHEYD